ncbi:MAG: hypothetical protein QM723_17065 [Myxococcaceae bacterium]
MSAADLRIQLEGAYELVEAEVLNWEAAAQSLADAAWDQRSEWRDLKDNTVSLAPVLRQFAKRAEAGEPDETQLVARLMKAQTAFREALDLRLRGLGETVDVDTREHKVRRLVENLPVRYVARHWRGDSQCPRLPLHRSDDAFRSDSGVATATCGRTRASAGVVQALPCDDERGRHAA